MSSRKSVRTVSAPRGRGLTPVASRKGTSPERVRRVRGVKPAERLPGTQSATPRDNGTRWQDRAHHWCRARYRPCPHIRAGRPACTLLCPDVVTLPGAPGGKNVAGGEANVSRQSFSARSERGRND